jgi:DNA invertase Pin-like site-specific DNA recombinase
MLRIGYIGPRELEAVEAATALQAAACHVVRVETQVGGSGVLESAIQFLGAGDELVAPRLDHFAGSSRALLKLLDRLEARGVALRVLEPPLSSRGLEGHALRTALQALSCLEPESAKRRKPEADQEIQALRRAGFGPVEIARRVGVSRMTVWRKLKALEAA